MVGGAVLLAGGAAIHKLTTKDAERIEQHTGGSVEELTEEELVAAMEELGIQSIELDDNDQAVITDMEPLEAEEPVGPAAASVAEETGAATSGGESSYLDQLERLAALKQNGIITEEEFEAKKKQILGL
jgi:hypothetical protein